MCIHSYIFYTKAQSCVMAVKKHSKIIIMESIRMCNFVTIALTISTALPKCIFVSQLKIFITNVHAARKTDLFKTHMLEIV